MKKGYTKKKIVELLVGRERSVSEMSRLLSLSNQVIHRHLNDLMESGVIDKKGRMPVVLYYLLRDAESRVRESADACALFLSRKKVEKSLVRFAKSLPHDGRADFAFLRAASAVFSSNIEGNTLDINSFLNQGVLAKNKKKEVREIEDLMKGYEYAMAHTLSEKAMLQVHKMISRGLLAPSRCGAYRREAVGVFSSSGLEYMAIEHTEITSEMSILFSVIEELLQKKLSTKDALFWGQWVHLHFVLIHPFADGNGRIARLLEKWFVAQVCGKKYWYMQTEEYYWKNLDWYYNSLKLGVNYWEVDFSRAHHFFERDF